MKKLAALILVSFALVQPNFGFAQTQRIQYPAALANTYFVRKNCKTSGYIHESNKGDEVYSTFLYETNIATSWWSYSM